MIRAVVAGLHLQRFRADGEAHDLMAEADAEGRNAALDEFARGGNRVVARFRVAGAVRQEDAVRVERERVGGRGLCRQHGDVAAALSEHAQDVVLHAVVERDHAMLRRFLLAIAGLETPFGLRPVVGFLRRHDFREVHARKTRERAREFERLHFIGAGEDAAVLRALVAQDARELARVDARDRDDALRLEVIRKRLLRAEVGSEHRQVTDDQAGGMDFGGFDVLGIHADVADMRIGQRNDLAGVARIGEDLLIAGDRGVEHHFADRRTGGADRMTTKDRAVGECENCGGK